MKVSQTWGVLLALLASSTTVHAQKQSLVETPKPGECFKIELETTLNGQMKITREGKSIAIPMQAKNQHGILEKILADHKGIPQKVARHYEQAYSLASIGTEKMERTLRKERQLIVAQRNEDTPLVYSPSGPLTRSELEVTAEHLDTLHLVGLLPEKEVSPEETWKIPNATVQAMCMFDGLISQELVGKLKEVKEGQAILEFEGKTSGIESGAMVNLTIAASAKYDLLKRRLVYLQWKQSDKRDQGPTSPASEVESTTIVKRTFLEDEPKELTRAALAGIPSEIDPPGLLKQLIHREPQGKYSFLYPREWHIVGQTENHVVMRLMERGDFIAQATLTPWRKESPGKHISSDDFKKLVAESAGWVMEEMLQAMEIPSDDGRWIYQITARGTLDGIKVVQNYFVIASSQGDQLIATFTMKPSNSSKIGTRDVSLVNSIEFKK